MKNFSIWLAIACIPVYGFWVFPQWKSYEEKLEQKSVLTTNIQEEKEALKALQSQKETIQKTADKDILKRVPENMQQEFVMLDLQRISQETGFAFKSLNFKNVKNPEIGANQLTIGFSITGKKERLPLFLEKIENNTRFFSIADLNFQTEEVNGITVISMLVSVDALFQ